MDAITSRMDEIEELGKRHTLTLGRQMNALLTRTDKINDKLNALLLRGDTMIERLQERGKYNEIPMLICLSTIFILIAVLISA